MSIDKGNFYFIKDEYFRDFPDEKLMKNKEMINGVLHNRPCYYNFHDINTSIKWFIPISSKVDKYEKEYNRLVNKSKNKECDTIVFGYVLGEKRAFLIQNMCPVIDSYIEDIYVDKAISAPVTIDENKQRELATKARKVLALYRKSIPVILPNVNDIEKTLIELLKQQEEAAQADE